jgi:hypothetical protein
VALHLWQHGFEQGAAMHRIAQGTGAQQRGHGWAAAEALERAGEFDQRPLPRGEAGAQVGALALDQADGGFVGADLGLGLLDARRDGGGILRGFVGGGDGGLGAGL